MHLFQKDYQIHETSIYFLYDSIGKQYIGSFGKKNPNFFWCFVHHC